MANAPPCFCLDDEGEGEKDEDAERPLLHGGSMIHNHQMLRCSSAAGATLLLVTLFANVPLLLVTQGTRGVATRASRYGMDPSYLETCESRTLVLVQAESKEAVDNLPGILQVEGVDGIFVGDEVRMRPDLFFHLSAPCVSSRAAPVSSCAIGPTAVPCAEVLRNGA